jgi:hypothetical protein
MSSGYSMDLKIKANGLLARYSEQEIQMKWGTTCSTERYRKKEAWLEMCPEIFTSVLSRVLTSVGYSPRVISTSGHRKRINTCKILA